MRSIPIESIILFVLRQPFVFGLFQFGWKLLPVLRRLFTDFAVCTIFDSAWWIFIIFYCYYYNSYLNLESADLKVRAFLNPTQIFRLGRQFSAFPRLRGAFNAHIQYGNLPFLILIHLPRVFLTLSMGLSLLIYLVYVGLIFFIN